MSIANDFSTLITELEDNLQLMGVSDAEYDSTTGIRGLVARIPEIQPSNDGLLLWADKNIIQSEDIVTLNCLILEDSVPVSGTVIFESDIPINTITVTNSNHTVNSDYVTFDILSMESMGAGVVIGNPSHNFIIIYEDTIECYGFNNYMNDFLGDTNIQIKDNILTYDSSENGLTNIDISEIFYEFWPDDDLTVYEYFYDKVNTNSNSNLAISTYTGTGLDSVGFHAESSGVVSQNIYVTTPLLKLNVVWQDNNDSAGKRPSTVTYKIRIDGEYYDIGTLSASDNWSKSFDDLIIDSNKTYYIELGAIPGYYTTTVEEPDYTFTVTIIYLGGTPPTPDDDNPVNVPERG